MKEIIRKIRDIGFDESLPIELKSTLRLSNLSLSIGIMSIIFYLISYAIIDFKHNLNLILWTLINIFVLLFSIYLNHKKHYNAALNLMNFDITIDLLIVCQFFLGSQFGLQFIFFVFAMVQLIYKPFGHQSKNYFFFLFNFLSFLFVQYCSPINLIHPESKMNSTFFTNTFQIMSITVTVICNIVIIKIFHYESIKFQKEALQKQKQLQELNDTKDKFFSIIAHDLKSPFYGFMALTTELIEESKDYSNEEIKEIGIELNSSAKSTLKFLENLLEWAKIQRGLVQFNPEAFQLREMINYVVNVIQGIINAKSITIKNNINKDFIAYGDIQMLNTVFRNIISNAVKFSNFKGEITLNAFFYDAHNFQIEIIDYGVGMDDFVKQNLFSTTVKTSREGTFGEEGSGLGLLLCKEFIDIHNGAINVESELNQGTTFIIKLPFKES